MVLNLTAIIYRLNKEDERDPFAKPGCNFLTIKNLVVEIQFLTPGGHLGF